MSSSRAPRALLALGLLALAGGASGASPAPDWSRFGYDAARHNAAAAAGISSANVGELVRRRVVLDGTVDSSPISVGGLVVVTTSYGKTIGIDPSTGRIRWRFTPQGYGSWAGTYRITNSTPIADPDGKFVYAGAPDGKIRKLSLKTGRQVWATSITRSPEREKLGTALNVAGNFVVATTGGYIGDAPPYQGHVAAIDRRTGRLANVWNALCSDRSGLIQPSTCAESGAAIWARSGAVVDPATGNLLVATGDGAWDGRRYWGDSVLMLSPDAGRLLQAWTPKTQAQLDSGDVDLGSTAPALLPGRLAVQGGKDAELRLLDLRRLNGNGGAQAVTGGELQTVSAPGPAGVYSAPAVWRDWVFVTTFSGTGAYRLEDRRLRLAWQNGSAGTSPVVAGGLLYVYDPTGGGLKVYVPTTGRLLRTLPAGPGHWNSPIVTGGRVILPEGSANEHPTTGVLDIYRLP